PPRPPRAPPLPATRRPPALGHRHRRALHLRLVLHRHQQRRPLLDRQGLRRRRQQLHLHGRRPHRQHRHRPANRVHHQPRRHHLHLRANPHHHPLHLP